MTDQPHPLEQAIARIGLSRMAKELSLTAPAIRKWQRAGRLPRTDWTGETRYAEQISTMCGGVPSEQDLKGPWPVWPPGSPLIAQQPVSAPANAAGRMHAAGG